MDQDIRFQIGFTATTSGYVAYLAVPYRCVVRDVRITGQTAVSSIAAASAATVPFTVATGATTLGTVAVPAAGRDMAAGALGTYTVNASTGSTVLAANAVMKMTVAASSIAATGVFIADIELDPYARSL